MINPSEGAARLGPPPVQDVMELGWSWWGSAVLVTATKLGIADAIDDEPVGLRDLAVAVGADPDTLARLMRALIGFGVFRQDGPHRYRHTESSRALRTDHPSGVAHVMLTGSEWSWSMWAGLTDSVRTGKSAFREIHGQDFIEYLDQNPVDARLCHNGYSAQAESMNPGLVAALDLTGVRTLVDVGGGHGSLLRALLRRNPTLRGVLFDMDSVLERADPDLVSGELATRCRLVAGDCLDRMSVDADVYVFRQVLHMWDDPACVRALRNCATAAAPGARIVLVEQLVSDPPENAFDPLMDLHMLLVMGGRERAEQEYADMFAQAGLRYLGLTATGTPLRLLTAAVPG